jgi:DNA-binding response OmpR family regulator
VNLRAHGFEVHLASDGVEALEWVREMDPDLVLVDVMMPRMNGFQVVDRLRADPRTANVSIIMLTAKALTADKGWASPPVRTTSSKPFDPVELVARAKGTLRRSREVRAISPLSGLPDNARIEDAGFSRLGRPAAGGGPGSGLGRAGYTQGRGSSSGRGGTPHRR